MLDLCSELRISVNELLSGEMIKMNNYNEKAEQNLLEMKITYSNWNYSFYYWSIICNKNRTRYMKCPKCNEKSWNKKIISK